MLAEDAGSAVTFLVQTYAVARSKEQMKTRVRGSRYARWFSPIPSTSDFGIANMVNRNWVAVGHINSFVR